MITVGIYIKDSVTLEYNRVELFDDEKISVNSSIQNVNDISKTYTDFSQTFTVPASKQNNKIFRHWYENSNDNGFSTLVKADAYIEIDTIPFRSGKIQLESANVKDGQPQDYSITFIGALGSLKDKFNGLYLKDLTDTTYDFEYTASVVKDKVVTTTTSSDVMFPLISSNRYWNYDSATYPENNISDTAYPIRYNELFPAIRLSAVLNMIANDSNILNLNFNGSFLSDARFTNAYLYLKNADTFEIKYEVTQITFQNKTSDNQRCKADIPTSSFYFDNQIERLISKSTITITPTSANIKYKIILYKNNIQFSIIETTSIIGSQSFLMYNDATWYNEGIFTYYIIPESTMTFNISIFNTSIDPVSGGTTLSQTLTRTSNQTVTVANISISSYMPEIKIEDFFSGLLKMFNLTCYSTDGINYTVEQLESYYTSGQIRDITKYIKSDNINLNRVKTYKKINFEYEKSESLVNVGFNSANGIEYGSLFYNTNNDGDEYSIKLPFENLNFNNLQDKLQVGYALKTDLQKYTPKPVILYDYNPTALTPLTGTDFWFNTNITGGTSTQHTSYKAFGQEYYDGTNTYSLNFNIQQSTLTNEVISNSLYQQYYENYLANIFDSKARLIKVSGILPTSLLTTLKLNDRLVIRDKRYLINTFTTDLTTGEVQFELLTDFREIPYDPSIVLDLDAGNTLSYPGTGTLWTDLSGNNNNGTLVNGPTFDSANGGSIVFDGTNDYADFGNIFNYTSENFSFSYWVNFNSLSTNRVGQGPIVIYKGTFQINGYYDQIDTSGSIKFITNQSGVRQLTTTNSGVISVGNWYNIAYCRNGGSVRIYLNGYDITQTAGTHINPLSSSDNFRIANYDNGYIYGNFKLSNLLSYDRNLTPTEVLENFNGTKAKYGL